MKRPKRKVVEYIRCVRCGRLVERRMARPGPEGGLLGPECLRKAVHEALHS
jgi:hypothetical protein